MIKQLIFIASFILLLAVCLYIIFYKQVSEISQARVIVVEEEIEINGVIQNDKNN